MGIGKIVYAEKLFKEFESDLKDAFHDLQAINLGTDYDFYFEIPLDFYSSYGMNGLSKEINRLIRTKYKGKLELAGERYMMKTFGDEWPEECPFYNDENIYVKVL